MKVLVCGSRSLSDPDIGIEERLRELPPGTEISHGYARGVDLAAHYIAKRLGFPIFWRKPEWQRYGKRAGIVRNNLLLDREPDLVIAWWDGESKGCAHTIEEAKRRGIPVEVHLYPLQEPGRQTAPDEGVA